MQDETKHEKDTRWRCANRALSGVNGQTEQTSKVGRPTLSGTSFCYKVIKLPSTVRIDMAQEAGGLQQHQTPASQITSNLQCMMMMEGS